MILRGRQQSVDSAESNRIGAKGSAKKGQKRRELTITG
jgi:hypothetical protein